MRSCAKEHFSFLNRDGSPAACVAPALDAQRAPQVSSYTLLIIQVDYPDKFVVVVKDLIH
jgi:hypothetical protein